MVADPLRPCQFHHRVPHVVAPAGLARNIKVQCKAAGNRTEVTVTDAYIGLSEHGNMFVRSLDDAAYIKKMEGWRVPIEHYLKTGEAPKP